MDVTTDSCCVPTRSGGRIEIIINACSQTSDLRSVINWLESRLKGDARWHISIASTPAELMAAIKSAAEDDYEVVVAGGGDGTVGTVAAALVGSRKALGVLPIGTLNHFAKDLQIPLDLDGALTNIEVGEVVHVDVGQVNGNVFVNNSSLGLYPRVVHEREKQQRLGWGKWPAFVWAAVQVMRRYPLLDVRMIVDGETRQCRTPFVFVGNNKYEMQGFKIGIRERLDQAGLDVYFTDRTGRLGLVRLALRALLGLQHNDKEFTTFLTKEAWIATRHKRLRVASDGEVTTLEPPLHYKIVPAALHVVVPARKSNEK